MCSLPDILAGCVCWWCGMLAAKLGPVTLNSQGRDCFASKDSIHVAMQVKQRALELSAQIARETGAAEGAKSFYRSVSSYGQILPWASCRAVVDNRQPSWHAWHMCAKLTRMHAGTNANTVQVTMSLRKAVEMPLVCMSVGFDTKGALCRCSCIAGLQVVTCYSLHVVERAHQHGCSGKEVHALFQT